MTGPATMDNGVGLQDAAIAVKGFGFGDSVAGIIRHGAGNVNDTFLVQLTGSGEKFILQRINGKVFHSPVLIMENLRTVADHVARRIRQDRGMAGRRWEMVRIFQTRDGRDYVVDEQGSCWRGITFIAGAVGYEKVVGPEQAREAGRALGLFHRLVADLPLEALHDTLPGFHSTPKYLQQYDAVAANVDQQNSPAGRFCAEFIARQRHRAAVLEDVVSSNVLQLRIMHGDPKLSNILFDEATGRAIAMIDFDTVKPGLIHYDIGDCLRSCCNPLGEEAGDHAQVYFDIDLARMILAGYVEEAGPMLTAGDIAYLYDAVFLLAFELGLRFYTDYLAGNVYFKIDHRGHNLSRALVQFALAASIEKQEEDFRHLIAELF
jgi:Ser/Thr protein kinase RdoA (MazF antagonist)